MLHDLFHLDVSVWEKVIRTIAVYLLVLLLLRIAGKRALAQLTAFDLVVLLLLSNVVQNAIIGNETSLPGGLLGAAILLLVNYGIVRLTFKHRWLNRMLQGSPTPLYEHGHVEERNLRHELVTREELVAALRRQGLELDDVERVLLEPEGTINASPKPKPGIEDVLEALRRIEARLP